MEFSFNPWEWLRNAWTQDEPVAASVEPRDDRQDSRPTAQPFFICPSCGYSREQAADGRKFCQHCIRQFNQDDLAILTAARSWLNKATRTISLKDLMVLAADKDGIRRMMRPFYEGLVVVDQRSLKSELESAGFPGTNTFEMLVHWVNKRLNDRVRRDTLTAMYGPPIYFVHGGLPGLGK